MSMFAGLFVLPYPVIDPIALEVGPISIRWYGIAYMAGLLLGWLYIRKLLANSALWSKKPPMEPQQTDDLVLWATIGVIAGGRLGYVLFYEPSFFFANPLKIFAVWEGGMAFHGGLIGTGLAIYLFSRRQHIPAFPVIDLVAAAAPIGLFFGRIANFINAELWGRVSEVPWAMVFPGAGLLPRHPSQLYEATLEGIILFLIVRYFTHHRKAFANPGSATGIFLAGYGLARIVSEFFREYDPAHALSFGPFTAGIVYSIPMVLIGWYLIRRAARQASATE